MMLCMKLPTSELTWHHFCNHDLVFPKLQPQVDQIISVAKVDPRVHGLAHIRKGKGNKESPKANPTEFNGSRRPWSRERTCASRRGSAHLEISASSFMVVHIPQPMERVANRMELKFMNAHHTDSRAIRFHQLWTFCHQCHHLHQQWNHLLNSSRWMLSR